ncbi:uncharacterized protein [Taeniopygia guttata]|uniref:uncharacterized protein n=1 Tax=Taeniopygia guttata TaxID=59729 RepID=UPI003BB93803
MALLSLFFVLVRRLIQFPQPAGDGLDEATHQRMRERQELLDREMARLLQELEQQDEGWGAMLFGALQQWPFWVLAGILLLLGNYDVEVKEDSDVNSVNYAAMEDSHVNDGNGYELKKEGQRTRQGNGENKDVQVDQERILERKREKEIKKKNNSATIKAGNNTDVNEGEDNVAGTEEYMNVKAQESRGANDQRSKDWTGQEDSNECGNEIAHSGFPAPEEANMEVIEDGSDRNKDEEQADVNVEGNKNKDRQEEEQGNVAASEKGGSDGGREESASSGSEDREDTQDAGNEQDILLVDGIEWPVEDLERGCSVTAELMESFTRVFVDSVSNSFDPVPQEAIGVGSAFEGWSPCESSSHHPTPTNHSETQSGPQSGFHPPDNQHPVHLQGERSLSCATDPPRNTAATSCASMSPHGTAQRKKFASGDPLLSMHIALTSNAWMDRLLFRIFPFKDALPRGEKTTVQFFIFPLPSGKFFFNVKPRHVRQGDSDIFVVSQPTEAQKGNSSNLVSSQPAKTNNAKG